MPIGPLTTVDMRGKICILFGVDSNGTKTFPATQYIETSPGVWEEQSTPQTVNANPQIDAFIQAISEFQDGLQMTTVVPFFGGGVPGPVTGMEMPMSGWITTV